MKFFILIYALLASLFAQANCPENGVEVYILAGQSNAVGGGELDILQSQYASYSAMLSVSDKKLTWNYQTNKLEPLRIGANNNLLHDWPIFGAEGMISFHLESQLEKPFIMFKYAKCGTHLYGDWNSRLPGTLYHSMVDKLKDMEAYLASMGKVACYRGFFWMQGEGDSGPNDVGDYADHLKDFITDVRASLNTSDLPFILGRVNMEDPKPKMDHQQDIVAKWDSKVKVVETADLPQRDDSLHFNTEGTIMLGERFFQAYQAVRQEIDGGTSRANLHIYPVPFTDKDELLTIKVQNNYYCTKGTVEFIDMLGRLVYQTKEFDISPSSESIFTLTNDDLTHLASAVYIVSLKMNSCYIDLKDKDKMVNKKIIIL